MEIAMDKNDSRMLMKVTYNLVVVRRPFDWHLG